MHSFRDTQGLIIDVRGNGGGSRDALRTLFPYFMKPDHLPRVANVAKYRLQPGDPAGAKEGYLANRYLFPITYSGWTNADREAIRRFAAQFKPQWDPPEGAFSDWHYMLLHPFDADQHYHYDRPVVLLIDSHCFSATDIFVGAFNGWPNVTLLGTPTGGGSGRSQVHVLPNSQVAVQLSTMASFQPNGQLYDGNGIAPARIAKPSLDDLLGKSDSLREKAVIWIKANQPTSSN
jgi:C-terminal processing protease CtpA/Prc